MTPQTVPGRRLPARCEDYDTPAELAAAMAATAAPFVVGSAGDCLTLERAGETATMA